MAGASRQFLRPSGNAPPIRILDMQPLGRGGVGDVYVVRCQGYRDPLVLKQLRADYDANDPVWVGALYAECEMLRNLEHHGYPAPRLVAHGNFAEGRSALWFLMSRASGISLDDWMKANPAAPLQTKMELLRKLAAAIDLLHRLDIVHLDLKPSNIFVREGIGGTGLEVELIDFGSARNLAERSVQGNDALSYNFASPEHFDGLSRCQEAADHFVFGILCTVLLTGAFPFGNIPRESIAMAKDALRRGNRQTVQNRLVACGVPANLARFIAHRLLAVSPDRRGRGSLSAFLDLMGRGGGRGVRAGGRAGTARPRSWLWGALAAGAALAIAAIVFLVSNGMENGEVSGGSGGGGGGGGGGTPLGLPGEVFNPAGGIEITPASAFQNSRENGPLSVASENSDLGNDILVTDRWVLGESIEKIVGVTNNGKYPVRVTVGERNPQTLLPGQILFARSRSEIKPLGARLGDVTNAWQTLRDVEPPVVHLGVIGGKGKWDWPRDFQPRSLGEDNYELPPLDWGKWASADIQESITNAFQPESKDDYTYSFEWKPDSFESWAGAKNTCTVHMLLKSKAKAVVSNRSEHRIQLTPGTILQAGGRWTNTLDQLPTEGIAVIDNEFNHYNCELKPLGPRNEKRGVTNQYEIVVTTNANPRVEIHNTGVVPIQAAGITIGLNKKSDITVTGGKWNIEVVSATNSPEYKDFWTAYDWPPTSLSGTLNYGETITTNVALGHMVKADAKLSADGWLAGANLTGTNKTLVDGEWKTAPWTAEVPSDGEMSIPWTVAMNGVSVTGADGSSAFLSWSAPVAVAVVTNKRISIVVTNTSPIPIKAGVGKADGWETIPAGTSTNMSGEPGRDNKLTVYYMPALNNPSAMKIWGVTNDPPIKKISVAAREQGALVLELAVTPIFEQFNYLWDNELKKDKVQGKKSGWTSAESSDLKRLKGCGLKKENAPTNWPPFELWELRDNLKGWQVDAEKAGRHGEADSLKNALDLIGNADTWEAFMDIK